MQAFLGTRTAADINLVAQVLLLVGLLIGFALARRRRFRQHGNVQTAMVLLNLVLIVFAMVPSFFSYVVEGGTTTGTVATLMIVHGVLGLVVEVVAIYLILRMRTQLIPERFRVRNIKLAMRDDPRAVGRAGAAGCRCVRRAIRVPACAGRARPCSRCASWAPTCTSTRSNWTMRRARFSLEAVHRHAEHLINLSEGRSGPDYGDGDANGRLEDPGDGIGLRARLDAVVATTPGESTAAEATDAHAQLDRHRGAGGRPGARGADRRRHWPGGRGARPRASHQRRVGAAHRPGGSSSRSAGGPDGRPPSRAVRLRTSQPSTNPHRVRPSAADHPGRHDRRLGQRRDSPSTR